jgi:phosphoserine aminotransferase
MPSSTRALNFNAGPAALPLPALERAQAELLDFGGSGMSIMEQSHRGKEYDAVHEEALGLVRSLLDVPADYDVLFMQGGATQQFATLPMNFIPRGKSADYVVTGAWGEKAVSEGQLAAAIGGSTVRVAADSGEGEGKARKYRRVPTPNEVKVDAGASYVHLTSNETIHGVQYATEPGSPFPVTGDVPLVCDMSSDFMWRKVDVSRFSLIYAGAQKNIGPSGVVVVIAKKDFIAAGRKDLPTIFQYRVCAENNSLYNTPPTFGIYLIRNVLSWVKGEGGLPEMEKRNREKGRLLYGVIDAHAGFYSCPVETKSRSFMNIVFRLPNEALEDKFIAEAKKSHRMVGLKGHRSVGGIRVSSYNAVSVDWVKTLVDFMTEFAKTNG